LTGGADIAPIGGGINFTRLAPDLRTQSDPKSRLGSVA
jgi:hypothetical protein